MDISTVTDKATLNRWLRERNLRGYWDRDEAAGPPQFKPFLWKWDDIYTGMMKATQVVSMEETFRRNMGLTNPSLGPHGGANLNLGLQCVLPGEFAKAHRHSAAAIRFVVQGGEGAYSVVEGEPMPMLDGDLITTPHWTFHDHVNDSDRPVIWLDGLDVRLASLAKQFRQDFPADQQPRDKPVGTSARMLGHARPSWIKSPHLTPPFRYPWTETSATLAAIKESEAEPDPFDGYHLMYAHPLHSGPTLPTFACEMTLFTPNQPTRAHRHNSTTIYHVFRGKGMTTIDGERFEWSKGDFLVIPPWALHRHENLGSDDAILFSICDWPTIKALGLYEEETE